jgi:hypothetical protein
MTKLIGLGHRARQGKNMFAEAMQSVAPEKIKLYAFAEELKRYCAAHHDELFEKYPDVPRIHKDDPIYGYVAMLQYYGTGIVRAENPDAWVSKVRERIELEKPDVAVLTDVRFENEAGYVKQSDGVLLKIVRLKEDGSVYQDPNRPPHISEEALENYTGWDLVVKAPDGMIDSLKEAGRLIAEGVLQA